VAHCAESSFVIFSAIHTISLIILQLMVLQHGPGTNTPQQRPAQARPQPNLKPGGPAHPAETGVCRPIRNGAQKVAKMTIKKKDPREVYH
jgi:hypothetical protein